MKQIQDFRVKEYKWLNTNSYIIELGTDQEIPDIKPGNFAELEVPNSSDVFLRRPLSIFDYHSEKKTLTFFVKVVGKGTKKLGELNKGELVNIIYPLGTSFTTQGVQNTLIIGGGSGIAPLILLARELKKNNVRITFLIGGRSREDVLLTDLFGMFGDVYATTEDGTFGEKGLVTHHSIFKDEFDFDKLYTCGPNPMMKAVAHIAKEKSIHCEASLENMMACGFGACLCCVTETIKGNLCVCTDGPVFNTNDLKW